LIELTGLQWIA